MIVTVDVKDDKWKGALDELIVLMREAGRDASLMGAKEIQDATRTLLDAEHHSEYEWGAPDGAPPAMVSGNLYESIDAAMMTLDEAWVGPTAGYGRTGYYAVMQETGEPAMHGHPLMKFLKYDGAGGLRQFKLDFVELMPRPYLAPGTAAVVDSGRLTEIYVEHWTYAIEEVA